MAWPGGRMYVQALGGKEDDDDMEGGRADHRRLRYLLFLDLIQKARQPDLLKQKEVQKAKREISRQEGGQ